MEVVDEYTEVNIKVEKSITMDLRAISKAILDIPKKAETGEEEFQDVLAYLKQVYKQGWLDGESS